jgi:hypothetical protein
MSKPVPAGERVGAGEQGSRGAEERYEGGVDTMNGRKDYNRLEYGTDDDNELE